MLATPRASSVLKPRFAVGDRVFGASQGAYATKVVAAESQLQPVPPGWSFAEAAGLFVTAPTSYAALVLRAGVKQGDHVLVHAAAGGVGLAAVQSGFFFLFSFSSLGFSRLFYFSTFVSFPKGLYNTTC